MWLVLTNAALREAGESVTDSSFDRHHLVIWLLQHGSVFITP